MFEGRGISDSLKNEIANIYNLYVKTGYSIDNLFEFNLKLSNGNNKLIYIFISFIEGDYYGKFYIENKTYKIDFHLPIKCSKNKFIELIIHEFTHLIEYANIQDKKFEIPSYNSIKQALMRFNPQTKEMDYFKYMIYLTLDNEINANVAQTFNYLKSFNIKDKNVLRKKLDEYEKRKEYIKSISINKDKFIEDINKNKQAKNELEELNFLLLTKKVQNNYLFLTEINNIKVYITNWFNIFHSRIKKLLSKQEKLINEVVESINTSENFNSDLYFTQEKINNFYNYINKHI